MRSCGVPMNVDSLALVLADKSDFDFYYAIKSESQSVYWSGFSAAPEKANLLDHYMAMLSNEHRLTYILKDCDVRLGYLCVDKDPLDSTVEISYGISTQYAGRGLAKVMIRLWLKNTEPILKVLVAWIAESNAASIKTATAVGFRATGKSEYRQLAQSPAPVKFIKYIRGACG